MDLKIALDHRAQVEQFRHKYRTGLVTLLFTDIVGSTKLKQALGDRDAVAVMHHHHSLVREILSQFPDGQEISTAGDSFFLVFIKPSDAVRFALLLQHQLRVLAEASGPNSETPLTRPSDTLSPRGEGRGQGEGSVSNSAQVRATPAMTFAPTIQDRIGIHIGEVVIEEREGAAKPRDLYGMQVDSCARVMSLAAGNQILLTRSAFDNARQALKGEEMAGLGALSWLNHGTYQLAGVEEPVEICEVGEANLAALKQPADSEKARRAVAGDQETVLGWRPASGQLVPNTKWVLEQKLGEGGFGEVWLGRHQTMKERRVFKFCFRADRVRSLKREMTLFRILKERVGDHPNIVRLLEVYFDEPPFYVVMDHVEGQDLKAWCEEQGGVEKVPLAARLEIVAQIADALQAAHDAGVIHRDVKPGNILVSFGVPPSGGRALESSERKVPAQREPAEAGTTSDQPAPSQAQLPVQVKLTDFGIGQIVSAEAMAGVTNAGFTHTIVAESSSSQTGSQMYMAPELLAGKPASIRSDIYSLGVVLYQLLVEDLTRPLTTDWADHISDPLLRDDLKHCFAGQPEERFAGAAQLAENLRSLPDRRRQRAEQQAALVAAERAAYRRGMMKTALFSATVVTAFALLAAYSFNKARLAAKRSSELATARTHAEAERFRAQQNLYVSDMNLAAQAWEAGNLVRARELLDKYRPQPGRADVRGFEWRLIWGLAHEDTAKVNFDTDATRVSALALSPDGKQLALGRDDRTVQIMDLANERVWPLVETNPMAVTSLAFSSDGTRLATGSAEGAIKLWDCANWRERAALAGHTGAVTYLAFHLNGETLLSSGGDGTIKHWDLATGRKLQDTERPDAGAANLSISPEGTTVATFGGLNNSARFWSLASNPQRLAELPPQKGVILAVEFSPDAKSVIISAHDSLVTRRELPSLKPLVTYWQKVLVGQLALSADGKTLATAGSDNLVKIWDVESGQELRVLRGHTAGISHLVFSADGRTVASVGGGHTVRVWSIRGGEEKDVLAQRGIVVFMAVSPDGKMLATSDPNFRTVKLWDLGAQQATTFLTNDKAHVAFSPDGKWFALLKFTGALELWDLSAKPYLKGPTNSAGSASGNHLNFSPNGRILACRGTNQTVMLWDLSNQSTVRFLPNHSSIACATAFSPDSEIIATAGNQQIRLWRVVSQQLLATLPDQSSNIRSLAFSPDGRTLAAASGNTEVRLWDVSDPREPRPRPALRGHSSFVSDLAFSPDGKTLATGSYDSSLKLWDLALGQSVATLRGHSAVVACLAFAPGGNTIYTGSGDATVRVWHAPSFDEIAAEETKRQSDNKVTGSIF